MPILYKGIVLGIVYCFTILTPTITIFLFRKINGFARQDLSERKKRYVPILLTIISYVFCLLMMHKLKVLKLIPLLHLIQLQHFLLAYLQLTLE